MKTAFNDLVDVSKIAQYESVDLNKLAELASGENVETPDKKVLFLGVDLQNDFMEGGALGVPGSTEDMENTLKFIHNNLEKITDVAVSIDTHSIHQIFHASWWVDEEGNHPAPLTIISSEDVENGKWRPVYRKGESKKYVRSLEKTGQKQLCIWPYHCIEGTPGHAIESQLSKLIHFQSFVHGNPIKKIVKGRGFSEMYGIIQPEVGGEKDFELLDYLKDFDKIIVAGQAESHCVYESIKQVADYYKDDQGLLDKIYVLEDGMSPIPGFEEGSTRGWDQLVSDYGIKIVKSTDLEL